MTEARVHAPAAAAKRSLMAEYEAEHSHPFNQFCHAIGIPLIMFSIPLLVVSFFLDAPPWYLTWWFALVAQGVGWVFQVAGHLVEGNGPKFLQGPIFLLVGAAWWWVRLGRALTWPVRKVLGRAKAAP